MNFEDNFGSLEMPDPTKVPEVDEGVSDRELAYISECVDPSRLDELVARIDEVTGGQPPKAIDHDPRIAEVIEPVKDLINPIYLEAPSDAEKIELIGKELENIEGMKFEEWIELTPEERLNSIQQAEIAIAAVEHRPPYTIIVKDMPEGSYGYCSASEGIICLNSLYLESNEFNDYAENLDTIIHEGRHAYQNYNCFVRDVDNENPVDVWTINEIFYIPPEWDFEGYWNQPIEVDARAFAEAVKSPILNA